MPTQGLSGLVDLGRCPNDRRGSAAGQEYVPMLRAERARNDEGVRALPQGGPRRRPDDAARPRALALFRGRWSPHRVPPGEGTHLRVDAALSGARTGGHRLSDEGYRLFCGRTATGARS